MTGSSHDVNTALPNAAARGVVVRLPSGTVIPVTPGPAAGVLSTQTYPASTPGVTQQLLAANTARLSATITNVTADVLYVSKQATASATNWAYRLPVNAGIIIDDHNGLISAFAPAAGFIAVAEET